MKPDVLESLWAEHVPVLAGAPLAATSATLCRALKAASTIASFSSTLQLCGVACPSWPPL